MTARRATIIALLCVVQSAAGAPAPCRAASRAARRLPRDPSRIVVRPVSRQHSHQRRRHRSARGRPLVDLKPGDFELEDNGIVTDAGVGRAARPWRGTPAISRPCCRMKTSGGPHRDPGTRVFALFLDEFNVAPGETSARVREAATRFMTEHVRPGDLVHVLKPMEPVAGLRFTRDRGVSLRTIDGFEGRKGDYEPRTPFENSTSAGRPARHERSCADPHHRSPRADDEDRGTAAGTGRARADQRGIRPRRRRRQAAAARLAEPCARCQPFQPAHLHAGPARPRGAAGRSADAARADRGADTLRSLAAQTGGEATSDARELLPGLGRVSRDLDSYYVLTYQPSQATDGRFHPITVRSSRKDARLRVPSGYWSPAQQRVAHVARSRRGAGSAGQAGSHASPEPFDRHLVWLPAGRRRPAEAAVHLGADT